MLTIRNLDSAWIRALLVGCLLCVGSAGWAESGDSGSAADSFSALTAVDSVRTNLWLSESLVKEIVIHTLASMRPAPGAIRIEQAGKLASEDLLGQMAFEVMTDAGYEVFTAVNDTAHLAAVDYVYTYKVAKVDLEYPRVGRTLGVWWQWVDRDLSASADIQIIEADTGRLVFDDLVVRQFSDRIGADDFSAINSEIYSFTTAEPSESGWHRRLEEIVVVGTLTGMVAVYFANTGN
jgi:hypothetical protein